MSGFIQDFIEGFSMGIFGKSKTPKPEVKPEDAIKEETNLSEKVASAPNTGTITELTPSIDGNVAGRNRFIKGFIPNEVKSVKDVLVHPAGSTFRGIGWAAKKAWPLISKGWDKSPFWTSALLGLAGATGLGVSGWYNRFDYNNTAGIDIDKLVKYSQAMDATGLSPKDISSSTADTFDGIPLLQPWVSKDNLKSAWGVAERLNNKIHDITDSEKKQQGLHNLIAPKPYFGWGFNFEGDHGLTDILPDERYSNLPEDLRGAARLGEGLEAFDWVANNGTSYGKTLANKLQNGERLSGKQRDAFINGMAEAIKRLDRQKMQNTAQSMFQALIPAKANSSQTGSSGPAPEAKPLRGVEALKARYGL